MKNEYRLSFLERFMWIVLNLSTFGAYWMIKIAIKKALSEKDAN